MSFRGAANHAGTTPFALRRDAGRAAARAMAGLRELVLAIDPEMVANVGQVSFEPGAPNVVPGIATFQVEMRAAVDASLKAGEQRLRGEIERIAAEEGCQAEVRSATSWPPVAMFEGYVAALSRVCERSGRPWRLLDSGAGHDAEILASHVPAGMLFVPSHDGVSH